MKFKTIFIISCFIAVSANAAPNCIRVFQTHRNISSSNEKQINVQLQWYELKNKKLTIVGETGKKLEQLEKISLRANVPFDGKKECRTKKYVTPGYLMIYTDTEGLLGSVSPMINCKTKAVSFQYSTCTPYTYSIRASYVHTNLDATVPGWTRINCANLWEDIDISFAAATC